MGYHEYTTTLPILKQLEKMGHQIDRVGGDTDFFMESNKVEMIENWIGSIDRINLKEYQVVFFVDYWNMTLPLMLYKKGQENRQVEFVALCHGTVDLPDDVANDIPHAEEYEQFLKSSYDRILMPYAWLAELMGDLTNYRICLWPTELLQERERPELPVNNKVIYAHRFGSDKGHTDFLNFVQRCRWHKDDWVRNTEFIITDDIQPTSLWGIDKLGIKVTGRLNQDQLKELCSKGGYAWSSAKSETFGYAVLDLCSYGLTPLINNHPAYQHWHNRFKYVAGRVGTLFNDKSELNAINILTSKVKLENWEWYEMIRPMANNSLLMAEYIVEGN